MEHSQRTHEAAQPERDEQSGRQVEQEPARGRRMGTRPEARADHEIRAELDALLAGSDDFEPNEVELLVESGIVIMLGKVPSYTVKRSLEDLCASVRGVRELHDQLIVEGESLSQTSDGLRTEAPNAGFRGPDGPRDRKR
jgi:osmotically-inducible protein OsmY